VPAVERAGIVSRAWRGSFEVDELVLAQPVVENAQASGLHETPGRIGGQRPLARAPFGDKAAFDKVEGALGA
jgi:hypothetical protein